MRLPAPHTSHFSNVVKHTAVEKPHNQPLPETIPQHYVTESVVYIVLSTVWLEHCLVTPLMTTVNYTGHGLALWLSSPSPT